MKRRRRIRGRGAASPAVTIPAAVIAELATRFARNGYVRRQNPARLVEGQGYKKGDEVRLTAANRLELKRIRSLLKKAGFKPGKPFAKGSQFRQPVYGRAAVADFLKLIGQRARD